MKRPDSRIWSVAFIFEPGDYDEDFHALDTLIQEVAESMEGYIGRESWQSGDGRTLNSTYYWKDEASIRAFSSHPRHLEAKRQYARWYKGYHIVVAEIQRTYGDGGIAHITPNQRTKHD